MSITIDKNIPVPTGKSRAGRNLSYPFDDLAPGDSFKVPLAGKTAAERGRHIRSAGINWAKRRGIAAEFVTAPEGEGHVRIWLKSRAQLASTNKQG